MWSNEKNSKSIGLLPGRTTIGPLILMLVTPPFAVLLWYIAVEQEGSFQQFIENADTKGFIHTLWSIWPTPFHPMAWKILMTFMIIQLCFMRLIPGKIVYGPVTPAGNIPVYKENGIPSFFLTICGYLAGVYYQMFSGGILYDYLGYILSTLNLVSFLLCLFLYIKGTNFPSSTDCGSSQNAIFDFYWGTELYPRVLGWDIKQFTNCRFGMMFWAILICSYAFKQHEIQSIKGLTISNSMVLSITLQLIYIAKFFIWEVGYLRSIDIMHDRAGYYLCWGCMVWVPSVYTSQAMYLVAHPIELNPIQFLFILSVGIFMIYMNYAADAQRSYFRQNDGKCHIWGYKPTYIEASYITEKGIKKRSLLLTSGYWGLSRHFHYMPEILAAFCWSVPSLFQHFLIPYFYVIYLTILLVDRAFRDDARCLHKYGNDWKKYQEQVPSLIIPKIF